MKRLICIFLMLGLLLTGCAGLSYENLYTLPRASEDYYDLQAALNAVLEDGYSYLAPTSGARREPVQLVDLDGDGVDEAVAFFRAADRGEVMIYIFSQQDGIYTPAATIEGAGSAMGSAEYADLDGSGSLELILSGQVSEAVTQALQIYRYEDGEAINLLTTGCSRYGLGDLDGDSFPELVCLTDNGADSGAGVEYYDGRSGELRRLGEQRLRFSYDSLRQTQWGQLSDGAGCLVFSGVSPEGQMLTDLFTAEGDSFLAVTPKEDILSAAPIHSYYVFPEDLDGDGALEFPCTRVLPAYDEGSVAQWVVDWYDLSADGAYALQLTAYHSFSEGWYFQIPDAWVEDLIIKTGDESTTVSTVTLYQQREADVPLELLTIYTLRGAGRQAYAEEHSLTMLRSDSDSEPLYAVTLGAAELWEGTATLAQVSELFRLPGSPESD